MRIAMKHAMVCLAALVLLSPVAQARNIDPVSYTHLTLPTIYSV